MGKMLPDLIGSSCVKRYAGNPVLSKKDIPYLADLIFNAGVEKYHGKYYMIFRNDYLPEGVEFKQCPDLKTNVGVAESEDGINWKVREKTIEINLDPNDQEYKRFYDPRLTVIDDELYVCFAVDTEHGVRGGIGKIVGDFESIDVLSLSTPDNRNMVLFPEKVNGLYVRLERPFPVYSRGGADKFDMWISMSPDLRYWGDSRLLLAVEDVPYANDKIGPGAPPIKTPYGWLVIYHAVDIDKSRGKNGWEDVWQKRYSAGVLLLDLNDPTKIIGHYDKPLIAPEATYEVDEGFRTNAIFPGAMIAEEDGTVKIYYGACDMVECLAEVKVDELLRLCGCEINQ